jgi:hypothetical protein
VHEQRESALSSLVGCKQSFLAEQSVSPAGAISYRIRRKVATPGGFVRQAPAAIRQCRAARAFRLSLNVCFIIFRLRTNGSGYIQ